MDDFINTLGGLTLRVTSSIDLPEGESISLEGNDFSCDKLSRNSPANINIHITSRAKKKIDLVQEKIFSTELSSFYSTSNGYQQDIYESLSKNVLRWSIQVDSDFSNFYYYLRLNHISPVQRGDIVIDQSELAFNYFLLKHSFLNHQGIIIHAAGGRIQGKGIIFSAPSGTGKSTLSQLLQDEQNRLFSEDRLIIRLMGKKWYVWGTPWHGEGKIASNEVAPLTALVFLRQANETKISQLAPSVGLRSLLQTVSIPWYSDEWTSKGLTLCETLIQDVPIYELSFRPDGSAIRAVGRLAAEL